jgi:hypothetical protein
MKLILTILISLITSGIFAQDTSKAQSVAKDLLITKLGKKNFENWTKYRAVQVLKDSSIGVFYYIQYPQIKKRTITLHFESNGIHLKRKPSFMPDNGGIADCNEDTSKCMFLKKEEAQLIVEKKYNSCEYEHTYLKWDRKYEKEAKTNLDVLEGKFIWEMYITLDQEKDRYIRIDALSGKILEDSISSEAENVPIEID